MPQTDAPSHRLGLSPMSEPLEVAGSVFQDGAMATGADSGSAPSDVGGQRNTVLVVNGTTRSVRSTASLLSALRDELGLTGAKPGCGEGACGSCTVLIDGQPVRACRQPVSTLLGRSVTTVEGLAAGGRLHPVQQAFVETDASQCGYCTPGLVLSIVALLASDRDPDDSTVDAAVSGNVCRCGAYPRIRRAIERASELLGSSTTNDSCGPATPPAADRFGSQYPWPHPWRPERPWDMTEAEDRGWFDVMGDGLVVVLPPPEPAPDAWSTAGGGAWLHVSSTGLVTAFTGKVDVGQDNRTALRLLVAEELPVALDNVLLVMGDTDLCPYDMGTFGSRSMPDAGSALRQVAAHARTLLPVETGSRRVELVTGVPRVTPSAQWHTAGHPSVAPEIRDFVTGARRFVSDLDLPGLRHAAVLRPPVVEATLRSLNTRGVDGRAGVMVVHTPKLVGVVAADMAAARSAVSDLVPDWDVPDNPSETELEGFLRSHPSQKGESWGGPFRREMGDPDGALAVAPVRIQSTYTTAYIAHVPLETRVAVAMWEEGRLTVWTGTQTPFPVRAQVAASVGLAEEDVRIIVPPTGGGFGGKHAGGVATEAAIFAREAGGPVRVAWTRHEEFVAGSLRPAAVIDVDVGATASGELTAWSFTNINSGAAALAPPYRVSNLRVEHQPATSPLPQSSYRALAATANNFARESHIDELAHSVGRDPVEYRLDILADERLGQVLRAAADTSGWYSRQAGMGYGIACGLEKDGRVATAAKVRVDKDGHLQIMGVVTAYECGAVVNPDTVVNQIEGATVMALGGALFEAIHFTDGAITNGTFSDYRVPRIDDVPPIEVVLLDRPDLPSAGAGETPMIAVAPAIANAVFDATRRRVRSLPLTVDGVLRR